MSMTDARTALAQAFVDGGFFPNEDVAWENVKFEPRVGNKPWARFTFMPTEPLVASLGQDGLDQENGFFQVDLNYPLGTGDAAAMSLYDDMRSVFKAGNRFTENGQVVVIQSCGRTPGREFGGYYRVTVTVYFYAMLQR